MKGETEVTGIRIGRWELASDRTLAVPVSGAEGRLVGRVRPEPGSPTERGRALGLVGAGGGGGRGGRGGQELRGAEDEAKEENGEEKEGTLGQAEKARQMKEIENNHL